MVSYRKFALVGVSLISLAAPAMAAEAADEASGGSEIIVEARRRDESIQEVPQVVNAVTSEAINKLNIRKAEDLTSVVPGLSLQTNANGIGSESVVRGVRYDVNVSGNNGTIQFYYNDAPITAGALLTAMFDVGQVDVQRGPQGTLKGRSSPSGAITIRPHRPDMTGIGAVMNATGNDIHGYNLNGAVNLPIVKDKLAIRVAGLTSNDQGNRVTPVAGTAVTPKNGSDAARISLRADPMDGMLLLDFSYQTLKHHSIQYSQVQSGSTFNSSLSASPYTIQASDLKSVPGLPSDNSQKFDIFYWQAKLNLAGQSLTYSGSDVKQHLTALGPSDGAGIFSQTSATQFYLAGRAPALVPPGQAVPFAQPTDTRGHDVTHEIRLQNEDRIAGMFDYVIGYLNLKGTTDTLFTQIIGGLASPSAPSLPTTLTGVVQLPLERYGTSKEESIFGNITAHIGDRFELSGGLRRIWFKTDAGLKAGSVTASGGVVTGVTLVDNPAFRTVSSPKATVGVATAKYRVSDELMVYASYGTSWRPDTIAIGGPSIPSALQAQFLKTDPETSKNYEIGFKSDLLDRKLRFNVSAYVQKFNNYPYRAPGAGVYAIDLARGPAVNAFNYVAAVPVTVKGIEGDIAYTPNDNFMVAASFSYADGKIKNGLIPCLDLNKDGVPDSVTSAPTFAALSAVVGSTASDPLISTCRVTQQANSNPKFGFSLQSEYSHPVMSGADGYIRGLLNFKGDSIGDPVNVNDSVSSYGLVNLYLGVRDPKGMWDFSVYGKNITNTFRVLTRGNGPQSTGTLTHGTLSYTNYFGISTTEPREFGVNLRVALGSR